MRAAPYLPPGNLARFFPLFLRHQVLEQSRTDHVGPLSHEQRPRAFLRLNRFNPRIHRPVRLRWPLPWFLTLRHLRNRPNMLFCCAAASPNEIQPAVIRKFLKLCRQRCRIFEVLSFLIGQARIRVARHKFACKLAQRSNVVGHELRSCCAVHPQRQRLGMPQRRPHGFHRLTSQHRSHRLDRDRYDERHFAPHLLRKFVNGEDRRLDIPGVLASLDQQQIRSAFNEAFCLRVVGLSQFVERHAAGNRNRLGCWPHGTGYEPRLQRGTEFICRLPRQLGRALV